MLTPEQARTAAAVDRSYELDAQRHQESYTLHTSSALRKRALAESNGRP